MTIIDASATHLVVRAKPGWTRLARRLAAWLRRRRDRQRQRIMLSQLSDHLRKDIGLPPRPLTPIDLCMRSGRFDGWR